jgi:hypothetical protein
VRILTAPYVLGFALAVSAVLFLLTVRDCVQGKW